MCQQFSTSGVKINLLHIPGHTGIPGSTTADMHVKDTAYKIFKGEIAAPIDVSISTAFTVAGDIVKKSWQMTMGSRTNWTLYLQPDTSGQQQSPLSTPTWYWHFLLQVIITWYHAKVWQTQIRHIWLSSVWLRTSQGDLRSFFCYIAAYMDLSEKRCLTSCHKCV